VRQRIDADGTKERVAVEERQPDPAHRRLLEDGR
jgi:hypothetical protein